MVKLLALFLLFMKGGKKEEKERKIVTDCHLLICEKKQAPKII